MNANQGEFFISVDVETSGPSPGKHSLLAIGACAVADPSQTFYIELKPVSLTADPQAMAIHGLSLATLMDTGTNPKTAMERLAAWLDQVTPAGSRPVFVAFNAPFDWMFVCDYFHRYLGRNPFGHVALDIKSLFMGITGSPWSGTSLDEVSRVILDGQRISHHALEDALVQAEIFRRLLARM